MRILHLIIILLFILGCKTNTMNIPKHLTIEDAYKEKWYGGQPGVEGTKYTIELQKLVENPLKIDSMKINSKWYMVESTGTHQIVVTTNVNETMKPIEKPELDSISLDKPLDIDVIILKPEEERSKVNSNVVAYSVKGKPYFLVVDEFNTHEALSYP